MYRRFQPILITALALLFVGSTLHGVQAQSSSARTLVVEDGAVYLDGRRLSEGELPATLDVSDLNVRYSFSGIDRPVVELNGALYAIDDSLTPVDPSAVSAGQSVVSLQSRAAIDAQERAPAPQPHPLQVEYMQEMQERHQQLYERLVHERRMEAETYELARVIQQLPSGTERQRYLDSLRTTLNEIFELKQENRRREIEQLEEQLDELQHRLRERERVRDQMIEQRIQQLVGEEPNGR